MRQSDITLLLGCLSVAAGRPVPTCLKRIRPESVDWPGVVRTARANGVAPLLFAGLKRLSRSLPAPAALRDELQRDYHVSGLRNAVLHEQLARLLGAFADAGLPVALLKGAALAEPVWGDIALRPMTDLDLLIREEHAERAHAAMLKLGYAVHLGPGDRDWRRPDHHHLAPYFRPGEGTSVELHVGVADPYSRPVPEARRVWQRLRPVEVAGVPALIPSPEDMVSHLCMHVSGFDAFLRKARNLADLVRLTGGDMPAVDWNLMVSEAVAGGYARWLFYPLRLASGVLAADVPGEVLGRLQAELHLSRLEDCLLRAASERAALSRDGGGAVLPDWLLRESCWGLLTEGLTGRTVLRLARLVLGLQEPDETGAGLRFGQIVGALAHSTRGACRSAVLLARRACATSIPRPAA